MNIGFLFSGQGTQYPGMCSQLYKSEKIIKESFDYASQILGYDLSAICFENDERINKTSVAQPAILTASVAMEKLFVSKTHCKPDIVAGNSVGEFAALTAAGVLSFEDALRLVSSRAQFMESAADEKGGVMYDVKNYSLSQLEKAVTSLCGNGIACVSNINGIDNNVISGEAEVIEKIIEYIESQGAKTLKLNVSSGFHSPIMASASEKFKAELLRYTFSEPKCSVISNVTGTFYKNADEIRNTLDRQIISTVHWYETMKLMEEKGCKEIIEFGPKKTLKNLVLNNTSMAAYSYDVSADRQIVDKKYDVNKMRAVIFGEMLRAAVISKNNNTDLKDYKTVVVNNYREIENYYLKIVNEKYIPDEQDINECGKRLLKILEYKKVSGYENICSDLVSGIKNKLLG